MNLTCPRVQIRNNIYIYIYIYREREMLNRETENCVPMFVLSNHLHNLALFRT